MDEITAKLSAKEAELKGKSCFRDCMGSFRCNPDLSGVVWQSDRKQISAGELSTMSTMLQQLTKYRSKLIKGEIT